MRLYRKKIVQIVLLVMGPFSVYWLIGTPIFVEFEGMAVHTFRSLSPLHIESTELEPLMAAAFYSLGEHRGKSF